MNLFIFQCCLLLFSSSCIDNAFGEVEEDSRHSIHVQSNAQNLESENCSNSSLCLTPECIKEAARVLSNLDETVDPCDDFYQFACGGWINRHTIPEDKSYVDTISEVNNDLNKKLKILLEEKLSDSAPEFIKKIKLMYDNCMDLESIEKSGSKPLKKVLKKLGGWPVVEGSKWDGSKFDWVDTLITIRKLGFIHGILIDLYVDSDTRNNKVNIIYLDQTELGMPDRSYLVSGLDDDTTAAYYKLMVKSAKLLGADEVTAKNELLKALHFEIALANFSLPDEKRRNFSDLLNEYTVAQLKDEFPQIPWLKYLNGLLNDEILENETLIVAAPSFISKFADLITVTEKRVVANYMIWRVVAQSLSLLSKKWRDIDHEYNSKLTGESLEDPRWEQCLDYVNKRAPEGLSSNYVRHYFRKESKEAVLELVDYLRREFNKILDEADWMDDQTKMKAKAKADMIKLFIGYPDELLNDTAVEKFYENLTIKTGSYFKNYRSLKKWSTDDSFSKLRKPNFKGSWENHADVAKVSAGYYLMDNIIELYAGILQSPFFEKDRPNYMNFGAIGYVIGHEITHAFDDMGKQFDNNGNQVNWWDKTTDELYKKKAQCIIDQYSNYTIESGTKVNGINTQGENIADNGGMKEAYLAYQSWVKDHGVEQLLPGLKFTQNQMFWISTANVWCGNVRPEKQESEIISDPHSPRKFRIIGSMSNLVEFSNDFNCPPDSVMNRKHKCKVW